MVRVKNFQPFKTSLPTLSAEQICTILNQQFPALIGSNIVSLESLRANYNPEIPETAYNDYIKIDQPFPIRATRSSTRATTEAEA